MDEYALSKTLKLHGRELVNLSGQAYRAILIPPVDAISMAALDNLRAFAKAGGKVIFLEARPAGDGQELFHGDGPADISWATLEPAAEITAQVLAALPAPDVATDQATTWLKYNHRRVKDADLYFFFNEGEQPLSLKTTVASGGVNVTSLAAGSYALTAQATDNGGATTTSAVVNITVGTGASTPCTSLCAPPIVFPGPNFSSGNLGTNATCHETVANLSGANCGNFAAGRSFKINGVTETCTGTNLTLPAKRNGGYCMQSTSGDFPWAFFTTW